MLTNAQLEIIRRFARQYNVREVILFGSSLENPDKANDIDLAVNGIAPKKFFSFYGDLFMELDKPVDLVDLSIPSKLTSLIYKRGKKIYG